VLFASGGAALIYQLLWIKQLSLVVGVDVHAVTIAVSAFFAGLAAGGALFGRLADRMGRPLRLYALLELGVGVFGILTTLVLAKVAPLFALLETRWSMLAWAIPFALVGLPALLMGGTYPVLARAVAPGQGKIARDGGCLYAANTAGAVLGALLTSFLLLPGLGVQASALVAAGINTGLAILIAFFDKTAAPGTGLARSSSPRAQGLPPQARLALVLYSLAGGIALGYEVVWSQVVVQFTSTRAFAFAIVLATYLTGLVIGSSLYSRVADRVRDPWGVFGLLIAGASLVPLFQVAALGDWLLRWQALAAYAVSSTTGSHFAAMSARFCVAALCIVFVPTVLLGAAFPAALRIVADEKSIGQDVGALVAVNTIGGVAGTFVTGFVLVPAIGLVHTFGILAAAGAAVGLVAVALGWKVRRVNRWATGGIAVVVLLITILTPRDRLAHMFVARSGGKLLFHDESAGGTVAAVQQGAEHARFNRLYIQGVSNSGDAMASRRYMRLQALLPVLIHGGEPRSALVIGFGTGITAGALLAYRGLERRVCAELLPSVVRAAPLFQGNFGAASDPRIEIRLKDGRRELLRSPEQYDIITLEPPPPSAAGVVNLYSGDFYELARTRLRRGGLLAQWWPLATQNDEDSRSLVRSFLDTFPHVTLWTTEFHEMLLIGSQEPIELDAPRIAARYRQSGVAAALREIGIGSPAALLATWITDRQGLERYAGDTPPITDDHPWIEYASWLRRGEFQRVLQEVVALRTEPPLQSADDAFRGQVAAEGERLLRFYEAGLYAYAGQRERWASALRRVLADDGNNPYYRWIIDGQQPAP
jgi:spermidine synthase